MQKVQILRIVVASPGDVKDERELVERVANDLNRGVAAARGLRFQVVRWETDALPGFKLGGPQELIDTILRIEDSDIVIGIFWKKLGTPTTHAASGTVHELEKAITSWKKNGRPHIMVYFNQNPYSPKTSNETEQWTQVLKFKEHFPEEGLWWEYSGEADFEMKLRDHLNRFILNETMIPREDEDDWLTSLPSMAKFVELGTEAVRRKRRPLSGGVADNKPLLEALYHLLAAIKEIEEKFSGSFRRGRSKNLQDIVFVETAGGIQKSVRLAFAVEDIILEHLKTIESSPYSYDACTVESDEGFSKPVPGATHTWLIDPIDGSRHLGRGLPLFTTSVALLRHDEEHGVPVLGVIYAPVTKELFFAVEGCGAYLNDWDYSLQVSDEDVSDAYVHVEFPNLHLVKEDSEDFEEQVQSVAQIFRNAYRVRGLGLGTLGLAYVAKGTFDAYVTLTATTLRNDVAAGTLLVREAGGRVEWFPMPLLHPKNPWKAVRVIAAGEKLMNDLKGMVRL